MFGGGSLVPTVHAGKVRGLASTGKVRNPATPELPTIDEIYPGYEALIWHGLFVPAGTPQPIIDRLRTEMAVMLVAAGVQEAAGQLRLGRALHHHARGVRRPHQERLRKIRRADPSHRREDRIAALPPHPADDRADDQQRAEPGARCRSRSAWPCARGRRSSPSIVVSTKPNQISAAEMTPPRSVNAFMCTRMPYSAQAMMISPMNTRMNGAAFAAPDLPASRPGIAPWSCPAPPSTACPARCSRRRRTATPRPPRSRSKASSRHECHRRLPISRRPSCRRASIRRPSPAAPTAGCTSPAPCP